MIWGKTWPKMKRELEKRKKKAKGRDAILWQEAGCLVTAGGKKPYRWHLRFSGHELFIGNQPRPRRGTPNAYVSLGSESLWKKGLRGAVSDVEESVQMFGGRIERIQTSRCDPCVDVLIPGGLLLEMVESHRVPRHRQQSSYKQGDQLETYYNGARGAEILLRIYDKTKEVSRPGGKAWFHELWQDGVDATLTKNVWRVEYQLRRQALKQFSVDEIGDLESKLPGLWHYLTTEWFSLRIPGNTNASRREVHPLWSTIQATAERFGTVLELERTTTRGTGATSDWYVKQIAGYLIGYSAANQVTDLETCIQRLRSDLRKHGKASSFSAAVLKKAIEQGKEAA